MGHRGFGAWRGFAYSFAHHLGHIGAKHMIKKITDANWRSRITDAEFEEVINDPRYSGYGKDQWKGVVNKPKSHSGTKIVFTGPSRVLYFLFGLGVGYLVWGMEYHYEQMRSRLTESNCVGLMSQVAADREFAANPKPWERATRK